MALTLGARMVRRMDFKMNPGFEAEMGKKIQAAAQEAVNATSRAHHEQGEDDVAGHLKRELEQRGINITDDEWLSTMSEHIRSGQAVIVADPDEFGADADE